MQTGAVHHAELEPEVEVEQKALAIPEQAKAIRVIDNGTMVRADETQKIIRDMIKEIDGVFKPMADKAFQAHRAITSKWGQIKAPLEEADKYLKSQVKAYLQEVQRKADEERRRLEEEARKKAEEERLRLAEEAEKAGNIEEAQALIEEPVFVEPVKSVTVEVPKVDGRKYAVRWKAEVTAKDDFIIFIADMIEKGRKCLSKAEMSVYMDYVNALDVNTSWLNNKAKANEDRLAFPGVRPYSE